MHDSQAIISLGHMQTALTKSALGEMSSDSSIILVNAGEVMA